MNSAHESIILDEVEALRAIYGEEHISFQSQRSTNIAASITISLEKLLLSQPHPAGSKITLSTLLPNGYPRNERPKTLTLRGDGLSWATAARIVAQMMDCVSTPEGEVCLFQYCQEMISILNDLSTGDVGNGGADPCDASGSTDKALAIEKYSIIHGEPLTDRKSVFQAHAARVKSMDEVDGVLQQLKESNRKIATATHNSFAYRLVVGESVQQDVDDDGEQGAGKCVMYIMQQMDVTNVICVVSRWFGGTKLGPVRFKHICKVARDVMEQHVTELFPVEGHNR